jgi:hypothetical protein
MVAKNDITGDSIMTKTVSSNYRDNYDRIFGKKKPSLETLQVTTDDAEQTDEQTETPSVQD